MVKVEELRKGVIIDVIMRNREVHLPTMGVGYKIYEIQASGVVVYLNGKAEHELLDEDRFFIPCKDLTGIPLTEEWLVRCGFECFEDGWYGLERRSTNLNIFNFTWNIYDRTLRWKGSCWPICDYVHQLQNIYHALYNTELEIKGE